MKYKNVVKGTFICRPNRFVAKVSVDGEIYDVHVKNTGRCGEILVEGATVYLEDFRKNMGKRTLPFSLIGVEKHVGVRKKLIINIDSQAPNKVVHEALKNNIIHLPGLSSLTYIKPESIHGNSRLDFYVRDKDGKEGFIEVKGVTLESDGIASFPDAPTERGIKHIHTLENLHNKGLNAYIIFVIQMEGMKLFTPNEERHPEFARALRDAKCNGVSVLAYDCKVSSDSLLFNEKVETSL